MQALKKSGKVNKKIVCDSTLDFNGIPQTAEFDLTNGDYGSLRVGDALQNEFNTNPTNFSIYCSEN
jgi:hypothetical protein